MAAIEARRSSGHGQAIDPNVNDLGGAVLSDGRFVDRAMIEGARTVVALAGRRD